MILFVIFYIAFIVFVAAAMWKTFEKAGQPGWACLIPFYNFYILAKIGGVKNWWLVFIPLVNIYIIFVVMIALAKSFGKETGFGIGLVFFGFIFFLFLGFGDAKYIGPNGAHAINNDINQIGSK